MASFDFPGSETLEIGVTVDEGSSYESTTVEITRDGHGRVRFSDGTNTLDFHSDEGLAKLFAVLKAISDAAEEEE